MAFRPEKLQAAGRDILKEPVSLCRQFHAGFTADKEAAAQVGFQFVDNAGHGWLVFKAAAARVRLPYFAT